MAGMTVREAETLARGPLQHNTTTVPSLQLAVINRRVVVFPGGGGDAEVDHPGEQQHLVLEVLAEARGINKRGHAGKVKLFRQKSGDRRTTGLPVRPERHRWVEVRGYRDAGR